MFPDVVNGFTHTDNCDRESCNEKSSYEAIRWIHRQLDDDANGDIDIEETDEVSVTQLVHPVMLFCLSVCVCCCFCERGD